MTHQFPTGLISLSYQRLQKQVKETVQEEMTREGGESVWIQNRERGMKREETQREAQTPDEKEQKETEEEIREQNTRGRTQSEYISRLYGKSLYWIWLPGGQAWLILAGNNSFFKTRLD